MAWPNLNDCMDLMPGLNAMDLTSASSLVLCDLHKNNFLQYSFLCLYYVRVAKRLKHSSAVREIHCPRHISGKGLDAHSLPTQPQIDNCYGHWGDKDGEERY